MISEQGGEERENEEGIAHRMLHSVAAAASVMHVRAHGPRAAVALAMAALAPAEPDERPAEMAELWLVETELLLTEAELLLTEAELALLP
jgi:hypothetical protein